MRVGRVESVGCVIALGFAVVSCATVSGLADYGVVDCPGGCPEVGGDAAPDATPTDGSGPGTDSGIDAPVDTGPPACDPTKDANCIQLPAGFTLVARLEVTSPTGNAACPPGTGAKSLAGEAPNAASNACTCDSCTVTAPASCNGQVGYLFGGANTCSLPGDPTYYKNAQANTCQTDLYTGVRRSAVHRFTLPSPSGGTCATTPTAHPDRVQFAAGSQLCEDATLCSGGFCDAKIDAPYEACVAHVGDVACPAGFAKKHVFGIANEVDCTPTCGCNLTRAPCAGSVNHYTDDNCAMGQVVIVADDQCHGPSIEGEQFASYKVVATSTTTCNANGTSAPMNARVKDPRTVCCR